MMKHRIIVFLFLALLVMGGCATIPKGPSVMVLPPPEKPFEVFQADDAVCRTWAAQQIGLSPQETVNQNTVTGAAIGAASGLLLGTAAGADSARVYGWEAQRRYDIAYMQCMYAKGNQIPGVVPQTRSIQRMPPPPPPGSGYAPPRYSP